MLKPIELKFTFYPINLKRPKKGQHVFLFVTARDQKSSWYQATRWNPKDVAIERFTDRHSGKRKKTYLTETFFHPGLNIIEGWIPACHLFAKRIKECYGGYDYDYWSKPTETETTEGESQ